jgi:hypothetical protein
MFGARLKGIVCGLVAGVVCGLVLPGVALGAFAVKPGSFAVSFSNYHAGAHANVKVSFALQQNAAGEVEGDIRNGEVVFPLGLAGYPPAVKTCDPVQLQLGTCPVSSQIGTLEFAFKFSTYYVVALVPMFNMLPSPNQTAIYGWRFAGFASGEIVFTVGPDYKVHARSINQSSLFEITRYSLEGWSVPAEASHNADRGSAFKCLQFGPNEYFMEGQYECNGGENAVSENPVPYLVNPTECTPGEPLGVELRDVTSWQGGEAAPVKAGVGPFTGCSQLKFAPTLSVEPEQTQATSPTGYNVDLRVPQTEGANSFGTADLKDAVVKLPEGVVLSPAAATGLTSCSEAQVGLGTEAPVECPNSSKLGEVSIVTPALTGELKGALYLGGPESGVIRKPPFTVYLTFAGHGVIVKIRGTATPNPVTGQVTTIFDENPQLPFSELKLLLNGGSRATVANPHACGEYHAESVFTPWTSPFEEDVTQLSFPYQITGCQAPRFDPSFTAGTTSNQAGGYSPLTVSFSREDTDQELGGLTVTMPPGLAGNIAKVPLCPEPQAAEGTCPESSQIGEVTAGAGPGPEPVFIKGGKVFLTGPYQGAPFGLSIDVSEKAGPLDLGTGPCDCEVVRATINVNPITAQITVSNGALPTGKYGIPFQVKSVNVDINRPEFTFNPTDCEPLSVTGTLSSVQSTPAQVSSRFQATNCAALGFKPAFGVSTSGHTSRPDGASLTAKLSYPNVGGHSVLASGLANIAKVKVELPKQLPSRLTTLQKACTQAVFNADPADCPADSRVGYAIATTPILPVPLSGPAFFVSNGSAKFPELIIVLQGDNVTVDLHGNTFISKAGITSTTFATIPDVPVGTFKLVLPEGPYSALSGVGDLCTTRLQMPTEFVSQSNVVIHQETPIAVTGCPPKDRKSGHGKKGKALGREADRGRGPAGRGGRAEGRR